MAADPTAEYSLFYLVAFVAADCFTLYAHVFYSSYIHFGVQLVDIIGSTTTAIYALYVGLVLVCSLAHNLVVGCESACVFASVSASHYSVPGHHLVLP